MRRCRLPWSRLPAAVLSGGLVLSFGFVAPVDAVTSVAATADAGTPSLRVGTNLSPNPVLARHRDGWRLDGDGTSTRVAALRGEARHALEVSGPRGPVTVGAPVAPVGDEVATLRLGVDVKAAAGTVADVVATFTDDRGRTVSTVSARRPTGPAWRTVGLRVDVPDGASDVALSAVVRGLRGRAARVTRHVASVAALVRPAEQPPTQPEEPPTQPEEPPTQPEDPPTQPEDPPTPPEEPPAPPAEPEPPQVLDNSVTQPALVAYGAARHAAPYAREGALVIAGRDNYGASEMKQVSAAGGTVLVYLDLVIDNPHGRYHQLLNSAGACGPATQRWPGDIRANTWGYLNDFRPGSVVQQKLECVLETMVRENPHIGGFFADDLGSRSWFAGFDWSTFGAQNQQAYREGAVAASRTLRRVADRHDLIVMVNGTWQGGSTATHGGGYPDQAQHGNALADGTFAENHTADAYWGRAYPCAPQWATQSPVTRGKAFNFASHRDDRVRSDFTRTGCYAFANTHQAYDTAPVWGPFRRTGLPTHVRRP